MTPRGRPPKPLEQHLRTGTYRADRHAKPAAVVFLEPVASNPEPLFELGAEGSRLWREAWASGAPWLQRTDAIFLALTCSLADTLVMARERYDATHDTRDLRCVVLVSKELCSCLSALGFTPTARARLGYAAVKSATLLDELRTRRDKP